VAVYFKLLSPKALFFCFVLCILLLNGCSGRLMLSHLVSILILLDW
jgi:hypothetical protein